MGPARRPADRDRPGPQVTAIRPYREADEAAVIALWQACGLTRPWNPPAADIAFARSSGHGELFLAEDAGEIVGSVMVGHDGHRGWVYYLAAAASRRQEGLGRRLMAAAEEWLTARGVRKCELMIRSSNEAAAGFYARLGYDREPVLVMSRWLDGTQR
jgi:ribosomal protein S18 acetylase RimI-like enzyme